VCPVWWAYNADISLIRVTSHHYNAVVHDLMNTMWKYNISAFTKQYSLFTDTLINTSICTSNSLLGKNNMNTNRTKTKPNKVWAKYTHGNISDLTTRVPVLGHGQCVEGRWTSGKNPKGFTKKTQLTWKW